MADQQKTEVGYERLGARSSALVDVLAQSVGFMGPVFSAALIIPLIVGVNAPARARASRRRSRSCSPAIGVFALGWIVAQYAKRIHAAGALYDYVTNGSGIASARRRLAVLRGHDHPDRPASAC